MLSAKQEIRGDFSDYEDYCHCGICGTKVKTKEKEKDLICEDYFSFYIICPTCYHYIYVPAHQISRNTRDNLHKKLKAKRELQKFIKVFIAIILNFTGLWLFVETLKWIIS